MYVQVADDLAEEIKRLSDENKKLREMLSVMCDNYNTLRKQYMNNCSTNYGTSRKRKAENSELLDAHFHGIINLESSDEDSSCNKSRLVHHQHIQSRNNNSTSLYVRTIQTSHHTNLVSPMTFNFYYFIYYYQVT